MVDVIAGGCLCGGVRYAYSGAVGPAAYCHCVDCRQCTGSAFNVSVRFDLDRFRITQGAPRAFTKRGDSGNALTRHFCPDCGSPIYTSSQSRSDVVHVKAGSLDDPSCVKPVHQSWTRSAVAWAWIDEDLPRSETDRA